MKIQKNVVSRLGTMWGLLCCLLASTACDAAIPANDPYLEVAQKRSLRIVDAMTLEPDVAALLVPIIADFYTDVHLADEVVEASDAAMKAVTYGDETMREAVTEAIKEARDVRVREIQLAFVGRLSALLDGAGVDAVKDGITYGRMVRDTGVFHAMLPELSLEERSQVDAWLWEARERALGAGSSEKKHWWFDKYRGRINNYLSSRGYDLKAAEQRLHGG